jgi:release factor glutamine methyltransferase
VSGPRRRTRNLTTKTQRHKGRQRTSGTAARSDSNELLKEAAAIIGRSEAEYLLMHVLQVPRHQLYLCPTITAGMASRFRRMVSLARKGEPVQYLTRSAPFFDFQVHVDRRVLIPRPETEELVARAIALIKSGRELQAVSRKLSAVDYGTGSGCIAIALARAFQRAEVLAVDASRAALAVARQNIDRLGVSDHVRVAQADDLADSVFSRLRGRLDLLISNPPYVPTSRLARLHRTVRREPRLALDGGPKGANIVAMLLTQGLGLLRPGGLLAIEIDATHEAVVRRQAPDAGIERDLAGRTRYAFLRRS